MEKDIAYIIALMKRSDFLRFVLICGIVAAVIIFTKAICEDEDSTCDILCNTNDSFRYEELFASLLSPTGICDEHRDDAFSRTSITAYLERHEKSPPFA